MTPDPSPYRIRRDHRAEWARIDAPRWARFWAWLAAIVTAHIGGKP